MRDFRLISTISSLVFSVILLSILITPITSLAQECTTGTLTQDCVNGVLVQKNTQAPGLVNPLCPKDNPQCSNSDAAGLLHSIVDWLIKIGTPIAVGMILIGAFQMLFSGGDEERFKRGGKTILYTAIGYAIILIGWGLTSIIQDFLSH